MTDNKEYQAIPVLTLERQIMDVNVPKNERKWWASKEIERLREDLMEAEKYNGYHQQACLEIERLRTEMERIADLSEKWKDSLVSQINEIARAALKGK